MHDIATTRNGQARTSILASHLDLADKINATHAEGMAAVIKCGQLLKQAKARVGHGNFTRWVEANCAFSPRTAQVYLKITENSDLLLEGANAQSTAHLTIAAAVRIIDDAKKPKFYAIPMDQWTFSLETDGSWLPQSPDESLVYTCHFEFDNEDETVLGACQLVGCPRYGWRSFTYQMSPKLQGWHRSRGPFAWFKWEWYIVGGHIPDHFRPAIAAYGWTTEPADPRRLGEIEAEEQRRWRVEMGIEAEEEEEF